MSEDDDDEGLKTVSEATNIWEKLLPPNHSGRIMLKALHELENNELERRMFDETERGKAALWRALLTVGTTSDGVLRYFLFPAASNVVEIAIRDALLKKIASQPIEAIAPDTNLATALGPSTTLAFAFYGERDDGEAFFGVAWRRGFTYEQAVGYLKQAIVLIRKSEANAAKGSN